MYSKLFSGLIEFQKFPFSFVFFFSFQSGPLNLWVFKPTIPPHHLRPLFLPLSRFSLSSPKTRTTASSHRTAPPPARPRCRMQFQPRAPLILLYLSMPLNHPIDITPPRPESTQTQSPPSRPSPPPPTLTASSLASVGKPAPPSS